MRVADAVQHQQYPLARNVSRLQDRYHPGACDHGNTAVMGRTRRADHLVGRQQPIRCPAAGQFGAKRAGHIAARFGVIETQCRIGPSPEQRGNRVGTADRVGLHGAASAWDRSVSTQPTPPPILFQDRDYVVIDKPAGLPVHGGPRTVSSVEDYFPQFSRRRDGPWLAHRLDADTAGCLVIALRRAALHNAQAEFAAGRARKTYWAVVEGAPPNPAGSTDAPLKKLTGKSGWRMSVASDGESALTEWRTLGHADGVSWLELHPLTGRTHQIRVHCANLGCPLLGDPVYGNGKGRLQLLARSIQLDVPNPLRATAPPPEHMRVALASMGWPRACEG